MLSPEQRIEIIRERLRKQFSPSFLEVIDDSHLHKGHAGAKEGAGHYTVNIQADCFKGKTRITAHREIYAALADLIPKEIHALQIILKNPN